MTAEQHLIAELRLMVMKPCTCQMCATIREMLNEYDSEVSNVPTRQGGRSRSEVAGGNDPDETDGDGGDR